MKSICILEGMDDCCRGRVQVVVGVGRAGRVLELDAAAQWTYNE